MSSFLGSKNHFLLFRDKRNKPVVVYSNHSREREIFFWLNREFENLQLDSIPMGIY